MNLIDTHAHIHFDEYKDRVEEVLNSARGAGLSHIFCVGTDELDSAKAIRFVNAWQSKTPVHLLATAGLHPHSAKNGQVALNKLAKAARQAKANNNPIVAIGECGLDYFKEYSARPEQINAFKFQIELALELGLPMIWHVRQAFDDFFKIIDGYRGVNGVVHCFSANRQVAEQIVQRGFMLGLNGIMTFTKDESQLAAAQNIPLKNIVLETDCPFLTPAPKRGTVNIPANVELIAEFLAKLRHEPLEEFARQTTQNARQLFKLGE